jgi:orotidine-5'-phosphate decarboxylase
LELFTAEGPPVVNAVKSRGCEVFLDLKFHDIPNTVAHAIRSAARLGVAMTTLHAAGGPAMMEAAAKAAEGSELDELKRRAKGRDRANARPFWVLGTHAAIRHLIRRLICGV